MISRITVSIIWFIFAVMFIVLGSLHWWASKNSISPFPHVVRPSSELEKMKEIGIDTDEPFNRFVPSFNLFLKKFNKSAQQQNKYAAYGYWIACGACLISVFLEWRDKFGLLKRPEKVENDKMQSGSYWVACFDLLGFKNLLKEKVGDKDWQIDITTFVETYYYDILGEAKRRVDQYRELLDKINYAWFSDTFLFYIPIDKKGHAAIVIESLARQFFLGCIWKGEEFPLRGALSAGEFYADKRNNIFVGTAFMDAYRYVEKQEWIGFVITPKACSELQKVDLCPPDRGKYIKYDVPIKEKKIFQNDEITVPIVTKQLFAYTMIRDNHHVEESINIMKRKAKTEGADQRVLFKYENTLKFINFIKDKLDS